MKNLHRDLAYLEAQSKQLDKRHTEACQKAFLEIEAQFAPLRADLDRTIAEVRCAIMDQMGAVEQIKNKLYDRQKHWTDADTTERMKKAQRREKKART